MRILYDSKKLCHKAPFGTLTPGQTCDLQIHVPMTVGAVRVDCCIGTREGEKVLTVPMTLSEQRGAYGVYRGSFSLEKCGLYFYFFRVHKTDSSFRLYKVGDQTNMESGDLWQVSCVPQDFTTPDWAKGAVIYQVFPDRFHKAGTCDLTGKLQPYRIHENWYEEVQWRPTPEGLVLNNDFYGGNFRGITEKMDYIASLGTRILYLNPISRAFPATATIPAIIRPPTPCWARWRISGPCAKRPTPGISR